MAPWGGTATLPQIRSCTPTSLYCCRRRCCCQAQLWGINGFCQGCVYPLMMSLLNSSLTPANRGAVMGLWSTNGTTGAVVATAVVGYVLQVQSTMRCRGVCVGVCVGYRCACPLRLHSPRFTVPVLLSRTVPTIPWFVGTILACSCSLHCMPQEAGWRAAFVWPAALTLASAVALAAFMPHGKPTAGSASVPKSSPASTLVANSKATGAYQCEVSTCAVMACPASLHPSLHPHRRLPAFLIVVGSQAHLPACGYHSCGKWVSVLVL